MLDRTAEARIANLRDSVRSHPADWNARSELGRALIEAGRAEEAVWQFREAQRAFGDGPLVHFHLGMALAAARRFSDAISAYHDAIDGAPDFAEAHNNLGAAYKIVGRLDDAVAAFDAARRIRPDWPVPHSNLAGVYEWQARHDDALACHRRAMALAPDDAQTHGNYLFTLLFHPDIDAQTLREAHRDWENRHAQPLYRPVDWRGVDCAHGRRLRIGYVGGLFRDHVVGRNLLPLLRRHDRTAIEVYCYAANAADDEVTGRFRQCSDEWRDIRRLSDVDTAAQIRRDGIDILVDTALHLDGNRLLVFARRPAPVQVTFAGYPGTTGITAIDYRLTDPGLDPLEGRTDAYAEASWRLPDTFWCYDALGADLPIGTLPADDAGFVTFGCLNNFSKVNDRMLALWSRVLAAAEHSRLLILSHEGSHREWARGVLGRHGVGASRVDFVDYQPRERYLALFNRIDISLDTLPYNGHTTSLDSLWMGVPVVTLPGETVVGRAGLSQLTNLALHELVASTPDDYVSIAATLASDRQRLATLRRTLRRRLETSPLMNAERFARHIELAYRAMWVRWCTETARL